jgi:ribonuclease E
MEPDQELVYGWLGLNPALLLDPVPTTDNLVVRVVRPGEDADAVLEEARQQLAASGPRRRRRGRNGSGPGTGAPAPGPGYAAEQALALPVTVEITPLPVETFPAVPVLPESGLELVVTASTPEPAAEPAGRRRVRSRAAVVDAAPVAVVAAVPQQNEPEPDDSAEPRRRRRRSSAAE